MLTLQNLYMMHVMLINHALVDNTAKHVQIESVFNNKYISFILLM